MPGYMNKFRDIFFGRHAWITNTISSGALFAIGDAAQQQIELHHSTQKNHTFDYDRNGKNTVQQFCFGARTRMQHNYLLHACLRFL